jgi:hypothetical protein
MQLKRIGDKRLLLTGRPLSVLALRAVLIVASVGLYVVGFLTVLRIVWLGVLLLVVATVLAVPANALMRAQIHIRRRSEADR